MLLYLASGRLAYAAIFCLWTRSLLRILDPDGRADSLYSLIWPSGDMSMLLYSVSGRVAYNT